MSRRATPIEARKHYKGKEASVFAVNLRARRLQLGMTQEQLGGKIGVPKTRISEMEGGRLPCNPLRLIALADALDTSLDQLFGRERTVRHDH